MIGTKIIEFDESNQTALEFKEIFKIDLKVPNDTTVQILNPIQGSLRLIEVGHKVKRIDLNDNTMIWSRTRNMYVNSDELGRPKKKETLH